MEAILPDEFYQPETGRARALAGAKDAADSFQKVSRSLRLTLALQTTVVDALRDLRAGVYRPKAAPARRAWALDAVDAPVSQASGADAEGSDADSRCERGDSNRERLVEYERLCSGEGFRVVVNGIRAEIGHAIDWTSGADDRAPRYTPFVPRPRGHETRSGTYSVLADGEKARPRRAKTLWRPEFAARGGSSCVLEKATSAVSLQTGLALGRGAGRYVQTFPTREATSR